MNIRVISYILGWVLDVESLFLLLPFIVGLLYGEPQAFAFLITALLCAAVGTPLILRRPENMLFYVKEGFVTVALCWIVLSLFGCLPFLMSGDIPNFTNALFETVSGFTTTGASILTDIESLSHAALFWRSLTHWLGGMGVLVFILAILPLAGGSQMNLMRAESPGPSVGKLVPKTRYTALILYGLYCFLTVLEFIFLICGKMPVFDAITTTFGTAGTGGFGVRSDSIAGYSPYIQWVVAVFMLLFGVNFNVYFFLLVRKWKQAFGCKEVHAYLGIVIVSTALICLNTYSAGANLADLIRTAFFQVSALISSTGYSTCNFDLWPSFSKAIVVFLMFIGACAGSTGGGFKVSRGIILVKRARQEIEKFLHPNRVTKIRLEGKVAEDEMVHTTGAYLILHLLICTVSTLFLTLEGHDLVTCFTAALTTLNNIGPGLAKAGPAENFNFFTDPSKFVLIFNMIAGRLELFPMLVLLSPSAWRRNIRPRKHKRAVKN